MEIGVLLAYQSSKRILTDTPDLGGSTSFILWSLVVLGLIIGSFILLKKFIKGTHGFFPPGVINVLARRRLSSAHEIYLVEVGPKILLIGLTRDRLNTLGEFVTPEDVSSIRTKFSGKVFQETLKAEVGEKHEDGSLDKIKDQIKSMQDTVSSWK